MNTLSNKFDYLQIQITEQLKEELNNVINTLARGQIHDFNDYRFCAGKISGLQRAIDIYEELMTRNSNEYTDIREQ